ncbi:hypothetical protein [Streptomyces sp. NPDC005805]|uniref:hypothetical protein n=1 Tax=Streptomyces sp. NPDC005805 TaxID=3157068 RepID=UPI0033E969EF
MPVRQRAAHLLLPTLCAAALLLTGCSTGPAASPAAPPAPAAGPAGSGSDKHADTEQRPAPAPTPRAIPGIGPGTAASLTDGTHQALVVTGERADTSTATAVLWQREDAASPWTRVLGPWPAHNGLRGWTHEHWAGDLRTPIGVFGLGDAGGRLPDPGALLPYDQDPEFAVSGTGFLGEPLEGSFDHVIAIDYNRVPGRTPLDKERPLGEERGGGVWVHVDHEGPTQACISLSADHMRQLLRALDPDRGPVIVMGPAAELRT